MKTRSRPPVTSEHSEFLILPDGKILAHNITPAAAKILSALNPADAAMKQRAGQKNNLKHELPN
jgi:hypothetical protein